MHCVPFLFTDAAGNFLCPATSLSFNAFKTVMEIDTMGTFNTSKVIYDKWFKVKDANYANFHDFVAVNYLYVPCFFNKAFKNNNMKIP